MARHGADPVEYFRRDPLGAPIPPSVDAPARMLPLAVPGTDDEDTSTLAGPGSNTVHALVGPVANGGRHRASRSIRHLTDVSR